MIDNSDFPIKGWKWFFYTIGLTSGVVNPVFWVTLYIIQLKNDKEEKFINNNFHVRVFRWGVFTFIITIVLLLFFFISIWALVKNFSQLDINQFI
jgi:hypothetical protein